LHALGILHYQSGQLEEAERLIGEAVAVNPKAADALYNRASLLLRLNRLDEAVECFDRAIVLRPDYVEAIGNRGVGKGVNFYSLEREIALGKGLAQEVERSSKLIDEPIVVEYVNRVGQNLVRNSDARVPFTIKVIDSDVVNAFALPGGFFYVNSGLILRAQEESELAGVMAHEMSHVYMQHSAKQAGKAQWTSLLGALGGLFGGGAGIVGGTSHGRAHRSRCRARALHEPERL